VAVPSISGSPNVFNVNGTIISGSVAGGNLSVNGHLLSTSGSLTQTFIGGSTLLYNQTSGSAYDNSGNSIQPESGTPYPVNPPYYNVNGTLISIDNSSAKPVVSEYGSYPYSSGSPNNPAGRDFFVVQGNSGYTSGWDSSGSPLNKIYTPPTMINLAQTISINANLGVRDIAVAQDPQVAGDGRNAEALFLLQTNKTNMMQVNTSYTSPAFGGSPLVNLLDSNSGSPVSDNIDKYNTQRVTELGLTIQQANTMSTQHKNLLSVLTSNRESVAGVNLDEEAANLMKFQRSYQASIRMMTAVDDLLNRVINNMGKAGM